MEGVYGSMNKIILDDAGGANGNSNIVPYLPLNELTKKTSNNSGESK
jgi:hypothetical protein